MSKSNFPLVLGGLLIVAAAAAAAYVGAQAGAPEPGTGSGRRGGADDLGSVLDRLDEIDRRLDHLAEAQRVSEQTAETALELATDLRDRPAAPAAAPEGGPEAPARFLPGKGAPEVVDLDVDPKDPDGRERTPDEVHAERLRRVREQWRRNLDLVAPARLAQLREVTPEAAELRVAQTRADALQLRNELSLDVETERRVTEVLLEELDSSVREVGPLLRAGDLAPLKERLEAIWARTDADLKAVLDAKAFEAWQERAKDFRAALLRASDRL